jgi:hypothetical protein
MPSHSEDNLIMALKILASQYPKYEGLLNQLIEKVRKDGDFNMEYKKDTW